MKKLFLICLITICTIVFSHPYVANAQYTLLTDFTGNGAFTGANPLYDQNLISVGGVMYGMTNEGGTNSNGTLFKILPNGTGYVKLLDFVGLANGKHPQGSLVSDGTFLYGLTKEGGTHTVGTLFKIMPNGTGYVKLLDFSGTANGSYPCGSLFFDGTFLYGMTAEGGINNLGTIFKILPNGTGYVKLLDFAGAINGSDPIGSLISDGTYLYGMTVQGGISNLGTIFKIMSNGTGYIKLLDFSGTANGSNPWGSLISDGTFLYGTTRLGGTDSLGTVFKIMPNGTGYVKLIDFAGVSNGSEPRGSLISDGTFLYGMTGFGGVNGNGTVFKILPDGTGYVKLFDFAGVNGIFPLGSLIFDGNFLYGITYLGGIYNLGTIFKIMPDGTGYFKLFDFVSAINGRYPYGSLISDGTFLYGMAAESGANNMGTLFKIMPDGTGFVKLLDFEGVTNGKNPYGSLIFDGTFLYGMTRQGGTNDLGTIFKILPNGTGYVKLLDFAGVSNGNSPLGSLLFDGTFLYGMTEGGGVNGMGTLFKIMTDGTGYVKLLDFAGTNGSHPIGSLISDGTLLYGMTRIGGTNNMGNIFKIMPNGTGYVKIFDFTSVANGIWPEGSLISDGTYLYGMTEKGGINNMGVIFKILSNGTGYVKLLDFAGTANGSFPKGTLISDGTFLYGMTSEGGTNGLGALFKITPNGTGYLKLFDFAGMTNGYKPYGSLISDGTFLYGTTSFGGIASAGTVFKYCIPVAHSQSISICAGQSFTVGTNSYSNSGTYTDVFTAINGCDSTVTTNLTVLPAISNSVTIVPATCGNNNGSASVSPSGGGGNFTFLWSNGDTTSTVTGLTGSPTDTLYFTITDANGCTFTDTAIVNCVTGVNEWSIENQNLIIYPNPNNGQFTISSTEKQSEISILNTLGEIIFTSTINRQTSTIDISNQPSGIYFFQLKSENGIEMRKIIKQ